MMQSNELRIGNWVKLKRPFYLRVDNDTIKVENACVCELNRDKIGYHPNGYENYTQYASMGEIEPIMISDVFEQIEQDGFGLTHISSTKDYIVTTEYAETQTSYLHDLQNFVYLALFKELEIEL